MRLCLLTTTLCASLLARAQTVPETNRVYPSDQMPALAAPLYQERYRPQFHFSPPRNFMNDPNGTVYFNGIYHLYYQYNAFGLVAGNQSWGHATSTDLVHWKNLPIAIPLKTTGQIFSGSAVVDSQNTSGFFNGVPGGGLVAIYTLNMPTKQTQNVAYSLDQGTTYTDYAGNPVIDRNDPQFRDPQVFWYAPSRSWIMAIALAAQHKVAFYRSPDLKNWSLLSTFGPAGYPGTQYEVPQLIQVPVEGTSTKKWVLLVSINPGAPQGGSATQYFLGNFDGTRFTADDTVTRFMEFGKDAYAMGNFNNVPGNDTIAITWFSNWQYTQEVPTRPWRGAMTVPRVLTLRNTDEDGLILVQNPVNTVTQLRTAELFSGDFSISDQSAYPISLANNPSFEFEATVSAGENERFTAEVRSSDHESLKFGYDFNKQQLFVDRGDAKGFLNPFFTDKVSSFLQKDAKNSVKIRALVDVSTLELFVNDGQRVASTIFFLKQPAQQLRLRAEDGNVQLSSLAVYSYASIWR